MDKPSFTDVDAEVLDVQPPFSDAEIKVELLETEDVSNDNDDATKLKMNFCKSAFPNYRNHAKTLLVFKR